QLGRSQLKLSSSSVEQEREPLFHPFEPLIGQPEPLIDPVKLPVEVLGEMVEVALQPEGRAPPPESLSQYDHPKKLV
ncbi:MAG: hypothetical protein WBJ65_00190, partial [Candidatus Microthrix parvicella]